METAVLVRCGPPVPHLGDECTKIPQHARTVGAEPHGRVELPGAVIGFEHPQGDVVAASLNLSLERVVHQATPCALPPAAWMHVTGEDLTTTRALTIRVAARATGDPADDGTVGDRHAVADIRRQFGQMPTAPGDVHQQAVQVVIRDDPPVGRLPSGDAQALHRLGVLRHARPDGYPRHAPRIPVPRPEDPPAPGSRLSWLP